MCTLDCFPLLALNVLNLVLSNICRDTIVSLPPSLFIVYQVIVPLDDSGNELENSSRVNTVRDERR